MVRKQQSARVSTGGSGNRTAISPRGTHGRVPSNDAIMRSPPTSPLVPESTVEDRTLHWCFSCVDGGDLIICNLCDRAMCTSRCLTLPEGAVPKKNHIFVCTSCHNDFYRAKGKQPSPYYGVYTGKLDKDLDQMKKAFSQPIKVTGPFALTYHSQVCLDPLVIIHVALEGIPTVGTPPRLIHEYLQAYFKDDGTLIYKEIVFNLKDEEHQDKHWDVMTELADELKRLGRFRCLLFGTTHGDKDRGDLFFSTDGCNTVEVFFENVLTEPLREVLATSDVICFLLVCGAMVTHAKSAAGLKEIFTSYNFGHLFAFTGEALIPALLSSLLLDFAHRIIVENHSLSSFIGDIIKCSPVISRHTSIVHLIRDTDKGAHGMFKYVWAHPDMAPYGTPLPHQCEQCLSFRPWGKRTSANGIHSFACEGSKGGKRCPNVINFAPPLMKFVPFVKSNWIKFEWE